MYITMKGTELDNLLKVNLASKMAAKLSFQSNIKFTESIPNGNTVAGSSQLSMISIDLYGTDHTSK